MSFKIGTVVTLQSNGLIHLANHNILSLGGDERFTNPLMIIIEVLYGTQEEIDEETGDEKSICKGNNKYKCAYFSSKTMKLEENWFTENEIVIYGSTEHKVHSLHENQSIKWGSVVRFKTIDEEAKKTKSFSKEERQKGIKPLLSYVAPAMQVIGFTSPDKKEPTFDAHTGKIKRKKPSKIVKCKFFNSDADKFSEVLIPAECLEVVDNSNIENHFNIISTILKNKTLGLFKLSDSHESDEKQILGTPQKVHVLSGRYQISIYNELSKLTELIWLDLCETIKEIDIKKDSAYYPSLNQIDGNFVTIDVPRYIRDNDTNLKNAIVKIVYKNLKEEINSRYIRIKEIGNYIQIENTNVFHIKGYCFYRSDRRDFRSDRILSLRTINDVDVITFFNPSTK